MAIVVNDTFDGYVAPPTSGTASFPTTDNTARNIFMEFSGTPTAGDQLDYTLTFPTGTVTFRARWSSSTTLLLERVSTIPGTSNGTATLQTFSGASTSKPRTTGDLVRMDIIVNRGAVNALTAITMRWHGRSNSSLVQTTNTFNVDGELTPTAASFAITGTSFKNRPDLEGRTAGSSTWTRGLRRFSSLGHDSLLTVDNFGDIGIVSEGVAEPFPASFDSAYVVDGLDEPATQVTLFATFTSSSNASIMLVGRWDNTTEAGFAAFVYGFGVVTIGTYTDGEYDSDLDDVSTVALDDDTEHQYDFIIDDTTATASVQIDGIEVLSVDISSFGLGSGTSGFGAVRGSVSAPEVSLSEVIIDDASSGPASTPCDIEISRHDFTATLVDLDEAALTNGNFDEHPVSDTGGESSGGYAQQDGAGRSFYLGKNISGLTANYCVEARAVFPNRDSVSSTERVVLWEDNFESIGAGEDLHGRVGFPGGPAGPGTWERVFTGDPVNLDGPAVVGDGEGRVMQPDGTPGFNLNITAYRVAGLTLPDSIDYEIDIYRHHDGYGKTGGNLRWEEAGAYDDAYWWHLFNTWDGSIGVQTNIYRAAVDNQPIGGIGAPFWHETGMTVEYESRIRGTAPGVVNVYRGGTAYVQDGTAEMAFYDGQFTGGVRDNFTGTVGLNFRQDGGGAENPLRVAAVRVLGYETLEAIPALERGLLVVGVRFDEASNTGITLELEFDHTGASEDVTLSLRHWDADTPTLMRTYPILGAHDATQSIVLSVNGSTLTATYSGVIQGTFDVDVDVADETGLTVTMPSSGFPAFGMEADNPADMLVDAWIVYGQLADIPCEGPPENPYPENPPPPPEPTFDGERPHQIGQWRETIVPSHGMRVGAFRQAGGTLEVLTKWVMQNGVWREIVPFVGETDPPSNQPLPPYYDPCELHPDLPLPPTETLGPPPARLFFAWDLPITTIPDLFNAAVNATGSHSPGNLSQASARGGYIIGGIGGYSKYQAGGQYSRALMQSWIASHASYMPAMVADPAFYGQMGMDDHAAFERWNWPSGWSINDVIDEISWIAAYWKTLYPGIRFGIRAREAQFVGSNYPSNIDFMIPQYRYWGLNRTPSQFVDEELGLAASRGHSILFSTNFENGGLGPSSPYGGAPYSHRVMYELGAGELNTIWEAETVDTSIMHGIGGWKYSAEFLGHPGILDVIAVRRNALQAIGAP